MAFFAGCESKSGAERVERGEEPPDFSNPEVFEKILGEAEFRDTLAERGPVGEKLLCAFYSEAPYTGWAKEMYRNGKVRMLLHYKDGRMEGPHTTWHDNGEKKHEGAYKRGAQEGLWTVWDEDGNKIGETRYKNGVEVDQ